MAECDEHACCGDGVQESGRYLGVHVRGSAAESRAYAVRALASVFSGVILAAMSRECWSTTVLRP